MMMSSSMEYELNSDWVEWLMGWPIGWTAFDVLETDRCPTLPPWPGLCFRKGWKAEA